MRQPSRALAIAGAAALVLVAAFLLGVRLARSGGSVEVQGACGARVTVDRATARTRELALASSWP